MKTSRAIHNKKIKSMRAEGLLPHLGQTTRSMLRLRIKTIETRINNKRMNENTPYLNETGSVLPNKFIDWNYEGQRGIRRPTPLLDGTEYVNKEGFRVRT